MHIQITDFGTAKIFESDEEEGKTERERERENTKHCRAYCFLVFVSCIYNVCCDNSK